MTIERKTYSRQFKIDAVKLVIDQGYKISGVARDLGIHPNLLRKWKNQLPAEQDHAFQGKGQTTRDKEELHRLQKEEYNINKIIFENALSGIYVVQHGKYIWINPIAALYTGYTQAELLGKIAESIIYPEDRTNVINSIYEMLSGKRDSPFEYRIVNKYNEIRWLIGTVKSIVFKKKQAILGNVMDITERKKAEKKLQETEIFYRTIFDTTGTATIIIEEDTTISLVNSEFEKLTGYSKEDWEGKKKWSDYTVEKDIPMITRYHKLRRIDPGAAPRNYEHDLIDNSGQIKNIMVTCSMIPGTQKSVASLTDVTALKEAKKSLQNKTEHLQELNAALRVLLKQREDDKEELEEKVLSNVHELALPYIDIIKKINSDKRISTYVDLLETNLKNIISPFHGKLTSKYIKLTNKEIMVANLIKEDKSSKEIAIIMGISKGAVDIHRYRLRLKLGLNKKKVNLKSYLSNISGSSD